MVEVLGVKFRSVSKISYFYKDLEEYYVGEKVVCKTKNGVEFGTICFIGDFGENQLKKHEINSEMVVLRKATGEDIKQNEENLKFEEEAFKIGINCIEKQKLNMKLIKVVSSLDRSKIIFFFTAEERVDFRALVKRLAFFLHSRVELRQIGIRDEAKIVKGIGVCGRPFCCCSFLEDFNHVSIKIAKEQNLSLNPKKISGCCGKLMCCLQYEQSSYNFLNKVSPKIGSVVMSPDGEGVVVNGNPLTGKYRIKIGDLDEEIERIFNKESLKVIESSKIKKNKAKKEKKVE